MGKQKAGASRGSPRKTDATSLSEVDRLTGTKMTKPAANVRNGLRSFRDFRACATPSLLQSHEIAGEQPLGLLGFALRGHQGQEDQRYPRYCRPSARKYRG